MIGNAINTLFVYKLYEFYTSLMIFYNPETEPASSALAGLFFTTESPGKPKERTVSPINNVKKTGQPHARVILDHYHIPHTKINPK